MADDDFETPEIWDEYQWERFLQQQDRNTEKILVFSRSISTIPTAITSSPRKWVGSPSTKNATRRMG